MNFIISCSIVLYKSNDKVFEAIESFLNTTIPVRLFLVDNSPTNALQEQLKKYIKDSRVEYIFNNKNLGYGVAHNIAINKIIFSSTYHLVLNPDVIFREDVLTTLWKYMESNPTVGLVTPKVFYEDGRIQYTCKLLPTPLDLTLRRFLPKRLITSQMKRFELRDYYDAAFEAPYIHGCFMFLRTEALNKVGLFDERFFMYPEDIDLTRRIYKEYKTMFYPGVEIVHSHAKESYKSMKLFYIHIVNMIRYFNKWGWVFDNERRKINRKVLSQFK